MNQIPTSTTLPQCRNTSYTFFPFAYLTVPRNVLSYTFFKKKRKIIAARKENRHKKGRSFVLAEKSSAPEGGVRKKKESRTPPSVCQRPDQEPAPKARGSARQEPLCTQLSCRLHFVIGCKYGFTWSVSDTFAEI